MSRPLRVEYEGAWYHVFNNGISQLNLFATNTNRVIFLELLHDLHFTFNVEIHAYSLTNNSYHLLLHTPQGNLSNAMRYLNGVFAQRFNRLAHRKGPIFCGRYKAVLFNADMYLTQVSRYIHWMPAINQRCIAINEYPWSSFRAYIGKSPVPTWLQRNQILKRFGFITPHNHYQTYTEKGIDKEVMSFYNKKHIGPILGPKSFRNKVYADYQDKDTCNEVADINRIILRPSIQDIIEIVENHYSNSQSNAKKILEKETRKIAMTLCRDVGGHSLKDIASNFNVGHNRSVSVMVSRVRKTIKTHRHLSESYESLRQQVLRDLC